MTLLIVMLGAAVLGGIIGYLAAGKSEDAVSGTIGAGLGSGSIILQIFLTLVALAFLLMVGNWLFG